MSVAKIIELSSTSPTSFEDALNQAVSRATQSLRNVQSAWVKDQRVTIEGNKISQYQVNVLVTFIMDDQ